VNGELIGDIIRRGLDPHIRQILEQVFWPVDSSMKCSLHQRGINIPFRDNIHTELEWLLELFGVKVPRLPQWLKQHLNVRTHDHDLQLTSVRVLLNLWRLQTKKSQ